MEKIIFQDELNKYRLDKIIILHKIINRSYLKIVVMLAPILEFFFIISKLNLGNDIIYIFIGILFYITIKFLSYNITKHINFLLQYIFLKKELREIIKFIYTIKSKNFTKDYKILKRIRTNNKIDKISMCELINNKLFLFFKIIYTIELIIQIIITLSIYYIIIM